MKGTLKQYLSDYQQIIRLGLPIIVGQAGMIVVGFADSIMVGNYGTNELSSASFVNNVFNMANLACMGFSYGITPLVGALFSKGKHSEIGELMRNALVLNVLYTLLIISVMCLLYFNIDSLGQPEELMPLIKPYYILILCGLLPTALFNVFAQCSYGMKGTSMPMWIILISNAINIVGNYLLIYGHFGAPELGLYGAGLSTLFSRLFSVACILGIFMMSKQYRIVRNALLETRCTKSELSRLFTTSLPISLQLVFETAAFSVAAIFVGWIGKIELAAFQVMLSIGTLGFCFYYSLGSATSVLVANASGRRDIKAMRRIGFAGYHLTLVMALGASLIFIFAGEFLIKIFTPDVNVVNACLMVILPMVCYQLGDATQVNFANALRGTASVMPMLWIAFFSYLVVGLPTTYLFGFTLSGGLVGIYYSFSVSLFLAGLLFLKFFLKYTRSS
ncbi:MAG: MATE family efflux transporter [Bacteroidales bacterium]|nr:MATE family efflux transporter [Bacteroidales bacterium]